MLRLTKRADYGMLAMSYLAQHVAEGKTGSERDIAVAYSIPFPVPAKTLHTLTKADLVASQQNATGGYVLTRPTASISTLEIISAFDRPPVITACPTTHGTCEIFHHCIVKEPIECETTHSSDELVKLALKKD